MAIDPVMVMSMIGSLFGGGGGGYEVPDAVRKDARWLRMEGRDMVNQSKTPVGSLPQEQAMLASMNALMGQQFGQQREQMAGALNPLGSGAGFTPDAQQQMLQSFLAQLQSGQSGMLQDFYGQRQAMRQQGLGNIQNAGQLLISGAQPQQGGGGVGNLAGFLSQYAQSQAFLNALRAKGTSSNNTNPMGDFSSINPGQV